MLKSNMNERFKLSRLLTFDVVCAVFWKESQVSLSRFKPDFFGGFVFVLECPGASCLSSSVLWSTVFPELSLNQVLC